jgi:mannose-6-phosphate isomerase
MATSGTTVPMARLGELRGKLTSWLVDAAYPLWARNGIDARNGGFIETLGQDGAALDHPRRARVHPRQIYAFAQAPGLGWRGDARGIVARGSDYFSRFYRRPDGLFRTLADADGAPLDEGAFLYDQAFALLGHAAAAQALDAVGDFEKRALDLRHAVESRFRGPEDAFYSDETQDGYIASNPHMHLLEACLAWGQIGRDPGWADWTRRLVDLAMRQFIRRESGALGEYFDSHGQPAPGTAGRVIEPGHQFEWGWLLLRASNRRPGPVRDAALRLIAIGEQAGVRNQVAINSLLDDFSVHDANARCWPQTERLKAALLAARLTAEGRYLSMAAAAAASLLRYLDTPLVGLWLDVQLPSGELVDSPAPASTFYHLVGAILALSQFDVDE